MEPDVPQQQNEDKTNEDIGPILVITEITESENIINNEPVSEESKPQLTFSLGLNCGGHIKSLNRKHRTNIHKNTNSSNKRQKICKNSHKQISDTELPVPVDPYIKLTRISRLLTDVNPYYNRALAHRNVFKKPEPTFLNKPSLADLTEIKIILPHPKTITTYLDIAHMRIEYFKGRIFDWEIYHGELCKEKSTFDYRTTVLKKHEPNMFNTGPPFLRAVRELMRKNQNVRWLFKRLVALWIARKCRKRRIGADRDLITLEEIPQSEQIEIVCMSTRCIYTFTGHTLSRAVRSNLEAQNIAIPCVKTPLNPFTNIPFTYGQMVEVYYKLLGWCHSKRKGLPSIIALYRETGFRSGWLTKVHHNYIQYRATHAYIKNDDTSGEFFLDNLENLLDTFSLALAEFEPDILTKQRFRYWFSKDPNNYLLKNWRYLVADFWYYEQTHNLVREHWRSEDTIIQDMRTLIKASEYKLKNIIREYN